MSIRDQYHPDYRKLYPGVEISPVVMTVLKRSDRKMEYMEVDLKLGAFQRGSAEFSCCREDSLERMVGEEGMEFATAGPSPEDIVIWNEEVDKLCEALKRLTPDEYELIHALFFERIPEHELAKQAGITQQGISKRLRKIYRKIRIFMKI